MSFDLNNNTCILNGNAEVKFGSNGENVFKADSITIEYITKDLKKPKKINARGNIHFYNKDISIKSNYCKFDMTYIEFYDKVIIKNSEFGEIIADQAKYNTKTKKIIITSKNKVKLKISDKKSKELEKIGKKAFK
jgi:lipopolysaccharide export system protein LptA